MGLKEALDELNSLSPETTTRQELEIAVKNYAEEIGKICNIRDKNFYPVYQFFKQYHGDPAKQQKPGSMWLEMLIGTNLGDIPGWPEKLRDYLKKILTIITLTEDTAISNEKKINRMVNSGDGFFQGLVTKMTALWSTRQINKKRKTAEHIKSTESKNENKLQNSSNETQKKPMMKKEKKLKESMGKIHGEIDKQTMCNLLRTYRDYNRYSCGLSFGQSHLRKKIQIDLNKWTELKEEWDGGWKKLTKKKDGDNAVSIKLCQSKTGSKFYNTNGITYLGKLLSFVDSGGNLINLKNKIIQILLLWTEKQINNQKTKYPTQSMYTGLYNAIHDPDNPDLVDLDTFLTLIEWDNDGVEC